MENRIKEQLGIVEVLTSELAKLKEENISLEADFLHVSKAVEQSFRVIKELMLQVSKLEEESNRLLAIGRVAFVRTNNAKYEILDPNFALSQSFYPKFYTIEETLFQIISEKKSLARFGDGEFAIITNERNIGYQKLDDMLRVRLKEVLKSKHPNLLIAIANNYGNLDKYTDDAADGIRDYMNEQTRKQHRELLDIERKYHDTYTTRPYVCYRDNCTDAPKKRFDKLKEVWKDRNVIIVEGAQTRIGVRNDLLSGAAQVRRILAPATNSFDRYDALLNASLDFAKQNTLFLVALGPSAEVLVYDLTLKGFQAVDIGHADMEYEWFLAGKGKRTSVPYKYNYEVYGGDQVEDLKDSVYESQIIARFEL
ncbi:GT-D fold domain-containing protein [Lachnospiraceae bacterium ZAX-1]